MKKESRSIKVIKNVSISIIYQVANLILNFILRTIFIKKLGVEILGINGLFSNILSVLSLADLGINTAMLYSLYKPLYNNDSQKISALLNYYKKIYNIIAFIIMGLGITVIPFLKYIVNSELYINDIIIYYVLYLINSVCSYFVIYKTCVVIADQKDYKLKVIDLIFLIIKFVVQLTVLLVYKNYILYLLSQICITILSNVFKSILSSKNYKIDKKERIGKEEKKSIWNNVKSLFLYQIGNIAMNNTDNILISIMLGTSVVGYYSNYTMIITSLNSVISMIFSSLQASIGNFNIESSSEQKYKIYKVILFFSDYLFSFCSITLICLLNPFIKIWLGEEYIFSLKTVLIIGFNFYVAGMLYPNSCYRFTTELFNKAKYAMLFSSIFNIVLSIILGNIWGIDGILVATAISRLITTFWYDAKVLYKDYFEVKLRQFFKVELINFIYTTAVCILVFSIVGFIKQDNIIGFLYKGVIIFLILNILYIFRYHKSDEFKYLLIKLKSLIKR